MPTPHTDTSEYAALVEFIATGGRSRAALEAFRDPDAVVAEILAPRARAMVKSVVTTALAKGRRSPPKGH